jgi:cytosine/adenosine deaminase-related metal-dependent hydrolase
MILRNLNLIDTDYNLSFETKKGKIHQIETVIEEKPSSLSISFTDASIFPGLINSHDHLDFNLFPQLATKVYENYTEWGNDIHQIYKQKIDSILKIPIELRENWGIYKNLLCGVTTVINHGKKLKTKKAVINVIEDNLSLHSVHFEKNWKIKLNNPLNHSRKAVIHIGEGTNHAAHAEVNSLLKWNILGRKLIGIHGVALLPLHAKFFEALVWCPQSNYFLLDKTAAIEQLKNYTPILFGTDSTLTSNWNIWNHLRLAQSTKMLTDSELYHALTSNAAKVWGLNCGTLSVGSDADLIITKNKGLKNYSAFFAIKPEDILLIVRHGTILLFDESIKIQLTTLHLNNYSKIKIGNTCKYVVGNLSKLITEIRNYAPNINFPTELEDN